MMWCLTICVVFYLVTSGTLTLYHNKTETQIGNELLILCNMRISSIKVD